jgi:hypothetical protein
MKNKILYNDLFNKVYKKMYRQLKPSYESLRAITESRR